MSGQNDGLWGKLRQYMGEAVHEVGITATLEIGATNAHTEQGVSSEGGVLFCTIEGNTARCVAGGLQYLKGMVAKSDDLVIVEETAYGRVLPTEWGTDDALEVAGDICDEVFVFFSRFYLESKSLIDGVDAQVVIPVAMCGKEMAGLQSLTFDVIDDGLALILIIGATVYNDTFERVVAHYVGVLLKQVESESFDGNHNIMMLADGQVDDMFATKPLFIEEGADVGGIYDIPERLCFSLKVASLEADDAIG